MRTILLFLLTAPLLSSEPLQITFDEVLGPGHDEASALIGDAYKQYGIEFPVGTTASRWPRITGFNITDPSQDFIIHVYKGFTSVSFSAGVPDGNGIFCQSPGDCVVDALDITGKAVAGANFGYNASYNGATLTTNGAIAVALRFSKGFIANTGIGESVGSFIVGNLSFEIPYGKFASDVPLTGDVDGDGKDDQIIWRPTEGNWYVLPSSSPNAPYSRNWGEAGDYPLIGHFTGRKAADLATFRVVDSANVVWYILGSDGSQQVIWWGQPGDVPAPADYDGDGKTDIAIYRPTTGERWIRPSRNPAAWYGVRWGKPE